jgi:hypothetical protein
LGGADISQSDPGPDSNNLSVAAAKRKMILTMICNQGKNDRVTREK